MFKHQKILVILGSVLTIAMTAYVSMTPATVEAREDKVMQETVLAAKGENFETNAADSEMEVVEKETAVKAEKETTTPSKKAEDKAKETKKDTSDQTASKPSENVSSSSNSKPSSGNASGSTSSNASTTPKPSSGNASGSTSSSASTIKPSGNTSKPSTGSNTSTSTQKPGTTSSNTSGTVSKPETTAPKPSVPETEAPHVHDWVEITHVEDQGYMVFDYESVWIYACNGCQMQSENVNDILGHNREQMLDGNVSCGGYTFWNEDVPSGSHWVEDLVTVSDGWRCSACGVTK